MQTTPSSQEALTFVVRLWREADAAGRQHWRARVEHVETQEVDYVDDVPGVNACIERWVTRETTGGETPTPSHT